MQVLKEDIRGRILAVAEQRFGQQGYSKTSMREIAGAVGVGVGNIYNYFRNKDELFCEVFRAQGSSLEHFRESYTDRSTGLVKAWFAAMKKKYPNINTAVSDFIIHLHTVWMFTLFEELLMHAVPKQEMESILHDYILFEIQGWRAIIKV